MRPLVVTSRGLRCVPADADVLLEALREAAEERFALPEWEAGVEGLLITLRSSGAVDAARVGRAGHDAAGRGHDDRARRHARPARRRLGLLAAERARGPDRRRGGRLGAADARPHAAARPRRPAEGGVELGGRVRGARARARTRGLRPLRAQAGAAVRAHRRRHGGAGDRTRAPRAGPVRAAARGALRGDQRRPARPRRGSRQDARALEGGHAVPRRRAAHPAGAPRRGSRRAAARSRGRRAVRSPRPTASWASCRRRPPDHCGSSCARTATGAAS